MTAMSAERMEDGAAPRLSLIELVGAPPSLMLETYTCLRRPTISALSTTRPFPAFGFLTR